MPRVWPVALGLMRAFRPTLTLWASLSLMPSSALACTCPPAMEVPITELYRWQIGRQDTPGRPQLKAIQPLLSPTLYQNLTAAYQLKPGEGLEEKLRAAAVPFEAVDVDLDPQLLARFDLEVPVLIHRGVDGERVLPRCSPRLGASQLAAWLTEQGVH